MFRDKRRFRRRKVCPFLADSELAEALDWKNPKLLRSFITPRGRILPRRITGVSALYQRRLTREIKRARLAALLPYSTD